VTVNNKNSDRRSTLAKIFSGIGLLGILFFLLCMVTPIIKIPLGIESGGAALVAAVFLIGTMSSICGFIFSCIILVKSSNKKYPAFGFAVSSLILIFYLASFFW
jgi:hypothetical protein